MFAVDDDFPISPKLESIENWKARALAVACWTLLGAACRKRGNGGIVSRKLLATVLHDWPRAERERTAETLVGAKGHSDHGLWERHEDGWRFHEWEVWQPTAEEAAEERRAVSAKTARQRRWRTSKRLQGASTEASTGASTQPSTEASTGPSTAAPTGASTVASLARVADADARARFPSLPVPSRKEAAAASGDHELPLTAEEASAEWHAALRKPGGPIGASHALTSWRSHYESECSGVMAMVPPPHWRTALRAHCEWFWHAPDGPIVAGRIDKHAATPRHLAMHVSRDLLAANAWWSERGVDALVAAAAAS